VLRESSLEWSVQEHYSGHTLDVYARDKRPGENPVNDYLWHPVERKRKQAAAYVGDRMADHLFVPAEIEAALGRRYIVGPKIAVGGQGVVFRATRNFRPDGTAAHDVVALKLNIYPHQEIRVQREITAIENISDPSLARLIEHGYCDLDGGRTRYVAWEFVEGQSLSNRLRIGGRLLDSEVLPIGRDVSAAIAAIWSRRIVHGDIKPSNIMLRDSGGAVLIDLGAARQSEDNTLAARKPFGTWGYFSPEQARGEQVTCASDIFSLGVVMLECLLGRHPTSNHQSGLEEGFRATNCRLGANSGLLCMLDKMLSERPLFRSNPADLSRYFQRLQQKMETESAVGARSLQKAHGMA
jgi:eukaryotic-like serine/threonine-protein kinase